VTQCTVVIGGDIRPGGNNLEAFEAGDAARVFGDVVPVFEAADYALANLECPLSTQAKVKVTAGVSLAAPPGCAAAIKNAGIKALNLANNHIMDRGPEGLRETLEACGAVGLDFVGAGRNAREARAPLVRQLGGVRVAFAGLAEHEYSIAGRESWGANPLDPIEFARFTRARRREFDHLVVLVHGGAGLYPLPSPRLQKTCRFLVEEGASAVICQHSHCVAAYERYEGAPIVYGQGNLVFDWPVKARDWRQGFLVELVLGEPRGEVAFRIVPYRQSDGQVGVQRMTAAEEERLRGELDEYCGVVQDEREIERRWVEFCLSRKDTYLSYLRGHGRLLEKINRRLRFAEHLFSARAITVLLHMLRCESENEIAQTILEVLYRRKQGDGRLDG
jgi:poly-gamma-glutamate capsule biosynthesis protein CapA/YwtB (metallophosphatase superfamily)